MSDELYDALQVDRPRLGREFFTPEPISITGNYYPRYGWKGFKINVVFPALPRYRVTGNMETGSGHVSYLARPYYSYKVPSRYGFSK